MINKIKQRVQKTSKFSFVVLVTTLILLLLPFFWTSSSEFHIGGDDSRLYTAYPLEWTQNVAWWSWMGASGFNNSEAQQFFLPLTLIGIILKTVLPFVNLQKLLYGLTLGLSFFTIYKLSLLLLDKKLNEKTFFASYSGGLLYVLAPVMYLTFWVEPVKYFFSLLLFPALFYFYVQALEQSDKKPLVIGGIVSVILSVSLASIPFLYAFLVGAIPFVLLYALFTKRLKRALVYGLIYILIIALFNAFWLLPFFSSAFIGQNMIANTISEEVRAQNAQIAHFIAESRNIVDSLLLLPSRYSIIFDTPYGQAIQGVLNRAIVSAVVLVTILFGLVIKVKNTDKAVRLKLVLSLIMLLVLSFLLTVRIGLWGVPLFSNLIQVVPGFIALRNHYIKMAPVFVFFVSIGLSMSLYLILTALANKTIKYAIVGVLLSVILIQSVPFVSGAIFTLPVANDSKLNKNVDLPEDYISTVHKLKQLAPESRVLHLPLTFGTWSILIGDNPDGYYMGTALTKTFGGLSTIAGKTGFKNPNISELPTIFDSHIDNYEQELLLADLGLLNVHYIVLESQVFDTFTEQTYNVLLNNHRPGYGISHYNELLKSLTNVSDTFGAGTKRHIFTLPEKYYLPRIYIPNNHVMVSDFDLAAKDYMSNESIPIYTFDGSQDPNLSENMPVNTYFIRADYIPSSDTKDIGYKSTSKYLPGSKLFGFVLRKEAREEQGVIESQDSNALINYYLGTANKRLGELYQLTQAEEKIEGTKVIQSLELYELNYSKAIDEIESFEATGTERNSMLINVVHNFDIQEFLLAQVFATNKLNNNDMDQLAEYASEVETSRSKYMQEIWQTTEDLLAYSTTVPATGTYTITIDDYPIRLIRTSNPRYIRIDGKEYEIGIENINGDTLIFKDILLNEGYHEIAVAIPIMDPLYKAEKLTLSRNVISNWPLELASEKYIKKYKLSFDYQSPHGELAKLTIVQKKDPNSIETGTLLNEYKLLSQEVPRRLSYMLETKFDSEKTWLELIMTTLNGTSDQIHISNIKVEPVVEPDVLLTHTDRSIQIDSPPSIVFQRINPIRYEVKVENAEKPYVLAFLESFHSGWQVYISDKQLTGNISWSHKDGLVNEIQRRNNLVSSKVMDTHTQIAGNKHYLANGYGNAWYIEPEDVNNQESYTLVLEFWPQKLFYLGLLISIVTIIIVTGWGTLQYYKKRKHD